MTKYFLFGAALLVSSFAWGEDPPVTGVILSYGSAITSNAEAGSGSYMPATTDQACQNAGIAKYMISYSGGAARAAWALCLGPENRPLRMYQCDNLSCRMIHNYVTPPTTVRRR